MRRVLLILPVALFAILIVVLGVLTLQTQEGRDPSLIPSPLVGKPAPEFVLPAVAENVAGGFSTDDLRGQVTMVNVFASWCIPCLAEHPLISRLAEDGLRIYGIAAVVQGRRIRLECCRACAMPVYWTLNRLN